MESTGKDSERPAVLQQMTAPKFFRFLDLPAEIRIMIYSLLLLFPEEWIEIKEGWEGDRDYLTKYYFIGNPKPFRCLFPTILRTCRQIQLEATPILYGHNGFIDAMSRDNLWWFFGYVVGSRNSSLVRRASAMIPFIDLNIYYTERRAAFPGNSWVFRWRIPETCPNIEVIDLRWCSSSQQFMKHVPMAELFEYFKVAVQYLKDNFPKLEQVLMPTLEDCTGRKKSDDEGKWAEICDFLEENSWVVGAEV